MERTKKEEYVQIKYHIKARSKKAARVHGMRVGKSYPVVGMMAHHGYQYFYIVNEKKKSACICPLSWGNLMEVKEEKGER